MLPISTSCVVFGVSADQARRVAESLELGIAGANGVLLRKGERHRHVA